MVVPDARGGKLALRRIHGDAAVVRGEVGVRAVVGLVAGHGGLGRGAVWVGSVVGLGGERVARRQLWGAGIGRGAGVGLRARRGQFGGGDVGPVVRREDGADVGVGREAAERGAAVDGAVLDARARGAQDEVAEGLVVDHGVLDLALLGQAEVAQLVELGVRERAVLVLVEEVEGRERVRHHEARVGGRDEVLEREAVRAVDVERVEDVGGRRLGPARPGEGLRVAHGGGAAGRGRASRPAPSLVL